MGQELGAIGARRNNDIIQARRESWRNWSAEAMDNGAKRAYRYAKEGAPDPIAGVRDPQGKWHCAPTKIAEVFAAGWKEIWNEEWEDPEDGFSPIPLDDIKKTKAITGRKLQAVALAVSPNKVEGLDRWRIPELQAILPEHWDELASILRRCEYLCIWPEGAAGSIMAMLPKEAGDAPTAQRPIGLLPMVYRIWAAARSPE
eukprot:11940989-Heterocapsa_arctica.AAC.1